LGHALLFRGRWRIGPATSVISAVYVRLLASAMQIRLGFGRLQKRSGGVSNRIVQARHCLAAAIGGTIGLGVILSRNRYDLVFRFRLVASIREIVVLV